MKVNIEKTEDRCCRPYIFHEFQITYRIENKEKFLVKIKDIVDGVRFHANVSTKFVLKAILTPALVLVIF